jgi:glycosyltransferase involved in cell wall biosynthesis
MKTHCLHLLGLPHTTITKEFNCCAYSQKILKLAGMLAPRGHEVILYSNEGADVGVDIECVDILSEAERASWFGKHDPQKLYDLRWDANEPYWRLFNDRCIEALKLRVAKGDFICSWSGNCQAPIAMAFPGSHTGIATGPFFVEAGVGYYGTFSRYRVFESHAHREWMMGAAGHKVSDNDTIVCENYWDLEDFVVKPISDDANEFIEGVGSDYYLFLGRIIVDKGWNVAVDVCRDIGAKLIIAGQGGVGQEFLDDSRNDHVFFFGRADTAERARLMSGAIACFCPTDFREPFGGTAVEAQLAGSPAITTDHGAFTQTVEEGWRCASHREFVEAALRAQKLTSADRANIKLKASSLYSLDAIAVKYERYFDRLYARWFEGYYEMRNLETLTLP